MGQDGIPLSIGVIVTAAVPGTLVLVGLVVAVL